MKNIFKLFLTSIILLLLSRCSNTELVEPVMPADDMATSANAYQDQYLTIQITTDHERDIMFELTGTGRISVNWGDGTIHKHQLYESPGTFEHEYDRSKNYTINISGDIQTITSFKMAYEDVMISNIHFGGLVNLKSLTMVLVWRGPSVINLSRSRLLETVHLASAPYLKDLILPSTNRISNIDISGSNLLTTAVVDRVIARVYDSVINSPRSGFFAVRESWAQTDDEPEMIGPPSSYSVNKLRKLRDTYGWEILPNAF